MSREAMEAAMDRSGVNDPFGQNILVSIGRFVAADSKQGWVSDRKAAEVAKCDKGTIGAWRERFLEMGIIETWTTGAGRGTKRWYKFLFAFDNAKHEPVINEYFGETSGSEPDNNDPDINGEMSEMKELLYGIRDLLYGWPELMSEIIVRNVRLRPVQDHHSTNLNTNEHRGEHPPAREETPPPAPEYESRGRAIMAVVEEWCKVTGRKPPKNKQQGVEDYGTPAETLLKHEKINWDSGRALAVLKQAREQMLADDLSPVRLSAVVPAAFAILDKPTPSANGHGGPRKKTEQEILNEMLSSMKVFSDEDG